MDPLNKLELTFKTAIKEEEECLIGRSGTCIFYIQDRESQIKALQWVLLQYVQIELE